MSVPSKFLGLVASGLLALPGNAGADAPIPLWPAAPPGDTGKLPEESDMTKPGEGLVAGKPVIRLGNVSFPSLTVFPAPKETATGAAVLVCPGGGYNILAWDLEGTEVCEWLNSIGVTGVLLKYRVPKRPDQPREGAPLQDAQRAMGLIRANASQWGIKADRVGVLGFSAGGNLVANLSSHYAERKYPLVDEADDQSCRPDFAVLIYAAYLTAKDQPLQLNPELKVDAKTPPSLLIHAQDDKIAPENSIAYFLALKNAGVRGELHVFPSGGHGYGLRESNHAVTGWPKLGERWMRGLGMLERTSSSQ